MIRACPPATSPPSFPPTARPTRPAIADADEDPYGPSFRRAYLANTAVMAAVAMLYRYADFVTVLGGGELELGWIVGVGTVGSLVMRLFLGTAIDRYGPRLVWLSSLLVFAISCFAHVAVTRCDGPGIYLLRLAFCSAIAGIFGSSMTFVSGRAPVVRMAEMIGMLGTSGFVGVVLGTQLGDLVLHGPSIERWQVDRMFLVAGTLGLFSVMFVWGATRHQSPPSRRRRPPLLWLLRRYFPGTVLLVGVAMGVAIALPTTFLRPYAAELAIPRIGLFFGVYAPTAIVTRVLTRRLPERFGLKPMILFGLGMLIVGQLLLVAVRTEWTFVLPATAYGVSHAILFPAAVAAGAGTFPNRYRGLGTTLMLATYDFGTLVGAPAAGAIVHHSMDLGLPGYPTLFVSVGVVLGVTGIVYGLTGRRRRLPSPVVRSAHRKRLDEAAATSPLAKIGAEA